MCGFICCIKKDCKEGLSIPDEILHHRGPDFTDEIIYKSVSIRHWRLSIVDLTSHSNQPLTNEDYIFAYNGELYNYSEISKFFFKKVYKSDTNLFFELLQNSKIEKIKNSSGFYSYILLNKSNMHLSGGRDLLGKKPLYYYFDDEYAIFASEEGAILELLNKKVSLNKKSLLSYFHFKSIFFGNSIFNGIQELPPGASFSLDINKWILEKDFDWDNYYSIPLKNRINPSFLDNSSSVNKNPSKNEIFNQLIHSLKSRFQCDVDLQLALSGGVDSVLIAKLCAEEEELKKKLLGALTIGFDHELDESINAKLISSELNIDHRIIQFEADDLLNLLRQAIKYHSSPLEHPHCLSYFVLCRESRKKGKVLITGEGADELFFGYSHYKNESNESFAFRPFLDFKKYFYTNGLDLKSLFSDEYYYRNKAIENKINSRDLEFKTHLISLLKRNDRMSMSNSVEIRAPFLDIQLLNLILNINDPDLNGFFQKKYLKMYLEKNVNFYRPSKNKIGFYVPFDNWFIANKNHKNVKLAIERGTEILKNICNLEIINKESIEPKLGWLLVNLGIFIEEFL